MAVAEGEKTTKITKNGDQHMETTDKYFKFDVHKDTIVIVIACGLFVDFQPICIGERMPFIPE